MSHTAYVALSYAAAVLLVGGLALSIWLDGRARRRDIAALEAKGVRRRSTANKEQTN